MKPLQNKSALPPFDSKSKALRSQMPYDQICALERLNVVKEITDMLQPPSPPLTNAELDYLGRYKASAMVSEDGSDEGDWLGNFLRHREQRARLV